LYYLHLAPLTHIAIYDSNKWYLLAKVFVKTEKTDSASYYLRKVTELHEMAPDYYVLWQTLYEKEGNTAKALYYAKRVTASTDSLYKRKLDVSFAGLEKKYQVQGYQLENKNLIIKGKQNNIMLLIILFVLSLGSIVVLAWRYRTKNQQLKTQHQLLKQEKDLIVKERENNELQKQQLKMKNILLEKEKENNRLQEQELKIKDILLSNVDQYRKHSVKRPAIENQTVLNPVLNLTFQEELVASMDIQHHDISNRLKERFPDLTERDILICCLLLADFDTGMIATILNVKNDSIKIHRSRLRKRLKLDISKNLTDYLHQF